MAEQPTTLWTRNDADTSTLSSAYYAHIAPEDLAQVSVEHRKERLQAHLELASHRSADHPAVDVLDVGHRSVVQVVTNDMPYLVDSVTAEVTRCGHAISLVVHPILLVSRSSRDGGLRSVKSLPTQNRSLSSGDTQTLPNLSALLEDSQQTQIESWISVEIDRVIPAQDREELISGSTDPSVCHTEPP